MIYGEDGGEMFALNSDDDKLGYGIVAVVAGHGDGVTEIGAVVPSI